ncbi:hypothetical protein K502DRAFT_343540 [Neoconidiobolus thromboides FSU 785]|nr:hypothetical protein K502DRAFT_343540 [Neoconidiobolus thromboides FSU 785]
MPINRSREVEPINTPQPPSSKKKKITIQQARSRIKLLKTYAQWLDAIPGLPIKIGLDGLIGLIPVIGDGATSILSIILIILAKDLNLPKHVYGKMIGNIVIDTTVGSIPFLGDVFDVLWRANLKNVDLMEKWVEENIHLFEQEE